MIRFDPITGKVRDVKEENKSASAAGSTVKEKAKKFLENNEQVYTLTGQRDKFKKGMNNLQEAGESLKNEFNDPAFKNIKANENTGVPDSLKDNKVEEIAADAFVNSLGNVVPGGGAATGGLVNGGLRGLTETTDSTKVIDDGTEKAEQTVNKTVEKYNETVKPIVDDPAKLNPFNIDNLSQKVAILITLIGAALFLYLLKPVLEIGANVTEK